MKKDTLNELEKILVNINSFYYVLILSYITYLQLFTYNTANLEMQSICDHYIMYNSRI